MEKQCSSLGPYSYHSVSFVTIPVVVMEFRRNSNCSPTLPQSPLTMQGYAPKPPVLWSNVDNSRLSCRTDYPQNNLLSGLASVARKE